MKSKDEIIDWWYDQPLIVKQIFIPKYLDISLSRDEQLLNFIIYIR